MKFSHSILTLSFITALSACNSSNSNKSTPIPEPEMSKIELIMPDEGSSVVEDFPIADYITYANGEQIIDAITSIDINWPKVNIHQANKEYGYIDGDSSELFYHSVAQTSNDAINATDLEREEDLLWLVSNNNTLTRYDRSGDTTTTWNVKDNAEFTELAISEDDTNNIWLYDKLNHQLTHFNVETEAQTSFMLTQDIALNGLSLSEDNLLMLAETNGESFVIHYQASTKTLAHTQSWFLEGFNSNNFNDIDLMPDGRFAVSTSDAEQNLYLVLDKSELIGAGPIEDSGSLELIAEHDLPSDIAQPSGIWSMQDNSWMIITDQAEMFALDEQFNILEQVDITFNSINCNQGCTEAIVGGTDEFFALTDAGLVGQFNKVSGQYQLTQEFQIGVTNSDGEHYAYAGLGKILESGEYVLVTDGADEDEQDQLIILNSDFTLKEKHSITYPDETEGSIFEYDAQGVQYSEGNVYVLSEKFTKVLQINLAGEITAVYDLDNEDVNDPSDLAIRDGKIYVLGDHENDEPVPPVSVFEIEQE